MFHLPIFCLLFQSKKKFPVISKWTFFKQVQSPCWKHVLKIASDYDWLVRLQGVLCAVRLQLLAIPKVLLQQCWQCLKSEPVWRCLKQGWPCVGCISWKKWNLGVCTRWEGYVNIVNREACNLLKRVVMFSSGERLKNLEPNMGSAFIITGRFPGWFVPQQNTWRSLFQWNNEGQLWILINVLQWNRLIRMLKGETNSGVVDQNRVWWGRMIKDSEYFILTKIRKENKPKTILFLKKEYQENKPKII